MDMLRTEQELTLALHERFGAGFGYRHWMDKSQQYAYYASKQEQIKVPAHNCMSVYVIGSIFPFLRIFILSAAIVAHFYEAMQLCNPPLHPTNVPTPRSDPRSDSYLLDVYMRHHSVLPHFPSSFLHQ